jgi:hypothetical protein
MRAHQKENRIKYAYKQTNEYIASLYESQAGCCLICGMAGLSPGVEPDSRDKKVLRIDHDHDTGEVRGLLCHRCNIGIGYLLEKPDLLRKAADYIEGHE